MANDIIKNKKTQYYPQPSYSAVHPIFIIGIVIICIPFVMTAFRNTLPTIISTPLYFIGLALILIGAYLSIMNAVQS